MSDRITAGKIKARHLLTAQKRKNEEAAEATLGRYAIVTAVSGDRVAVREAGDATGGGQLIAKAALPVSVGATGVLIPLMGGGNVFLPVGTPEVGGDFLPLTGGTVDGAVTFDSAQAGGFRIRDSSTSDLELISIDTDAWVEYLKGLTTIGRNTSDVEKYRLDAQTGAAIFTSFNSPVFAFEVQDTPTDSSNASNTVWDTNVEASIVLPTGTWTVYALTVGAYVNASVASVRQRTRIGASSAGSSWQMLCDSGLPVTFTTLHSLTGQTGTVTCYGQYQPVVNAQTVTAKGGSVLAWGVRTA